MPKIKLLPENLINKIAAGEVVERPASAVKELVENSLDAGASFIHVVVEKGGKDKITVIDNGEGITKEDVPLAFKRYATSKISSEEDLERIETLGFRGEALSSIAAVSKLTLKTKTEAAEEGTEIILEEGKQKKLGPCAHPVGTTVQVKDLFYNLPARKKFLKSPQTEFKHIQETLIGQALANPEVGFRLHHGTREVLYVPENQDLKGRIEALLEISLEDFTPVDLKRDYLSIQGFVCLPGQSRKRRLNQYLIVNNRPLSDRLIWGAMRKAYQGLIPADLHPQFILKLDIRPDLLDVNVHPRKEEVKFISPSSVFDTVVSAIKTALSQKIEKFPSVFPSRFKREIPLEPSARYKLEKAPKWPQTYQSLKEVEPTGIFLREVEEPKVQLFQLQNLYIVQFLGDKIIIYDQHAAHERILFEKFQEQFESEEEKSKSQVLLFPEILEVKESEAECIKENENLLHKLGFEIKHLEKNKIEIQAIPALLKEENIKPVFLNFLDDLLNREEPQTPVKFREALTYLACRSAVKEGDRLSQVEMKKIINDLEELGGKGLTCPHGRPTKITLSQEKLGKMFKRR